MLVDNTNKAILLQSESSSAKSITIKKETSNTIELVNQSKEIEDISKNLNNAISGINTNIRFGFDNKSNVFYVSVIDTETNKIIRRFPKEESEYLLERLKELRGFFIDKVV